ncbi:MAG TPA: hypothetical protein VMY78_09595 [Solirubrobacteraceae bacterium]|nr:hypothetical protein [Solirubrobacteraceae bacterium]
MLARRPPWLRELVWILATALAATLVTIVDLELWRASASVPISGAYNDTSFFLSTVKDVVEHGWFWNNPDLAAPFGQSNLDFAASFGDTGHYVIIRALAFVLGDPVVVFNAFYLLCFPLIAVMAYVVLRDLGAARLPALVVGVLFAFLPYHLFRHQNHLFLGAYYAVPLGVWLVVALAEGRTLLHRADRPRTLLTLAACVVVASASNYYAVFTMLVLVLVVGLAAPAWRSRAMAIQGVLVLAAIGFVFAVIHAPPVINAAEHGRDAAVAARSPGESEAFGLKLAQMVIPRPDHRLGLLARRGQSYQDQTPLRAEDFSPSLGVVATVGLLVALLALLMTGLGARDLSLRRRRISLAGAVALVCFLVGTVGGISSLIAFELSPQVRGWNRISLFIAFAALLVVALALTALGERLRERGRPPWVSGAIVVAVGVVGILDQTSPHDAPGYQVHIPNWRADEAFVRGMEDRLPDGTAVLQLPYVPFPEAGPVLGMLDYDLFKGYLHSEHLRWSYGATRGRPEDWQDDARDLTPAALASAATTAGFGAVYVDRGGYADNGAAVIDALTKATGAAPAGVSADGRLAYYDLRPLTARVASKSAPAQRGAIRDALLHPATVTYGGGFSFGEVAEGVPFRWAGPRGTLTLGNPLHRARRVRLTATLAGPAPAPSTVTVTLPGARPQTIRAGADGASLDVVVDVPPGGADVVLSTVGPAAAPTPGAPARDMRLKVADPKVRDEVLAEDRLAALVR